MKYADIIVDNNTNATDVLYSYISDSDDIAVGAKVRVPFTVHNRMLEGYVAAVYDNAPKEGIKYKKIAETVTDFSLSEEAVSTALWIRNRYLCRYIESVKLFLPTNTEVKRKTKDPFENLECERDFDRQLNKAQARALREISEAIEKKMHNAFLLHGVTGSGKTEVYIQAVERVIEEGRSAIVLVPEISLTPQTVSRFVSRLGEGCVAVLHSRLTSAQRAMQYRRIAKGEVKVVIGARSAVFAPFSDIGIIIIDEEHETTYKSDKSPKYDAIEVALMRTKKHSGVLLLGSATPSVSDYYRSERGIYKRLELSERYNENPLPDVRMVDMSGEVKKGNKSLFSEELASEIKNSLSLKKQVILFLNRRGYSSYISCRECGYTVRCPECGIAMTYHKGQQSCVCHYCGRRANVPPVCPECGSKIIGRFGAGTEQVEEKAKELFPDACIERLDLDTIKKKGQLESVLKRFAKGKTDILIGTQLVAKGLDFANVGLVGVISADVTLNIPDFRSSERTFQLVTQAAGRSGRGNEKGLVIIQTYQPENPALIAASSQDYKSFYDREIVIRESVAYPPFSDIFRILVSDEAMKKAEDSSLWCAEWLKKRISDDIYLLGPTQTALLKLDGMYRYQILLKVPMGGRKAVSEIIKDLKGEFQSLKNTAKLLTTDINPYSFM